MENMSIIPPSASGFSTQIAHYSNRCRSEEILQGLETIPSSDSSPRDRELKRMESEQYSPERQHLRELLQYIGDFKNLLGEEVLEPTAAQNTEGTHPEFLKNDAGRRQRNGEWCLEPEDERNDHAIRNMGPSCTSRAPPIEPKKPPSVDDHMIKEQRRRSLPATLCSIGPSHSSFTAFRSVHRSSGLLQPNRHEKTEDLVEPSALMKGRQSLSSTGFERVTGMADCSTESSRASAGLPHDGGSDL